MLDGAEGSPLAPTTDDNNNQTDENDDKAELCSDDSTEFGANKKKDRLNNIAKKLLSRLPTQGGCNCACY